jgi:parallel beta-helix repeat protein
MQTARSRLGVAEVNGKIYAIGGDYTNLMGNCIGPSIGTLVNTTEMYDTETDTWSFRASMPTARCSFAIAVYQNKIYCIGGCIGYNKHTGVNEVYDPATDTWETKTPMPTPRMELQANVVNGKIYLIGGTTSYGSGPYLGVNEVYDPATDTWTTKTPSLYPLTSGASAVADNKIYFLAKASRLDLGAFIQIYSPEEDNWKIGAASPTYGWISATAGVTSGGYGVKRIVFFDESSTCIYYPANDSWATGTRMPTARGFSGVAFVNGAFYVIGGIPAPFLGYIVITSSTATNEQYTPNENLPVGADTKIYIRADGSIEPSTANITTTDKIHYTFTGNNSERMVIERDNIILDGNGYTLQGTNSYGIAIFNRNNVMIENLIISQFPSAGIGIERSNNIIIVRNNIVQSLNNGIQAFASPNNTIAGNKIQSNRYMSGIQLEENSNNNLILGNDISGNYIGIRLYDSKQNLIYHNNLLGNSINAVVDGKSGNIWDDGYPSGGNYWSDYNGKDQDGDGIGDTPYIVNENNKDNYPLMAPFNISSVTMELPQWAYPSPSPSQDNSLTPESFPTTLVAVASGASIAIISIGLLIYVKRRKR